MNAPYHALKPGATFSITSNNAAMILVKISNAWARVGAFGDWIPMLAHEEVTVSG